MQNEKGTGARGDHSGKGRPRRSDEEYPKHRNADQLGTHGGPRHAPAQEDWEGLARRDQSPGAEL